MLWYQIRTLARAVEGEKLVVERVQTDVCHNLPKAGDWEVVMSTNTRITIKNIPPTFSNHLSFLSQGMQIKHLQIRLHTIRL